MENNILIFSAFVLVLIVGMSLFMSYIIQKIKHFKNDNSKYDLVLGKAMNEYLTKAGLFEDFADWFHGLIPYEDAGKCNYFYSDYED